MPVYQCDMCNDEVARVSFSDMETGTVQFIGIACLPLFGAGLIQALEPEVLDGVLKTIGYQPTKATRDARKAAEVPDYDPTRTIGEVVESAPRIDTGESVEPQGDQSTDQPSDLSTNQEVEDEDECPFCGAMVRDSEQENHFRTEHPNTPPY